VTAPLSPGSGGCGGRDAPAPMEGGRGKGRQWARSPGSAPGPGPAAASRLPAPTALARPRRRRRRRRRLRLFPARVRGRRRRRRRHLPRRALRLPRPLRASAPSASAASTPRALSHWEIPLLLHSPLRLPPTRGRVTQIPAWAAAGRGRGRWPPGQGLGLFLPPPRRNPERGPFTRQLGGTKWAPGGGGSRESRSRLGRGWGEGMSPGAYSPAEE
jgi:hypothetical protein